MRQTWKRVPAAALVVLAGCMSQNPNRGESNQKRFYAVVDTPGATGRDSLRVSKLPCTNKQTNSDSLTVLRNDPDTALVVDGHRLEIPRGSVPRGNGTTFRMTHVADDNELRVVLETVPEIRRFDRRLTLALSYESCKTDGVDLESLRVLRRPAASTPAASSPIPSSAAPA